MEIIIEVAVVITGNTYQQKIFITGTFKDVHKLYCVRNRGIGFGIQAKTIAYKEE